MPFVEQDRQANTFYNQVIAAALNAGVEVGVPVVIRGADSTDKECGAVTAYAQLIRDAVAEAPAGLVVVPVASGTCGVDDVMPAIAEAAASGVPVIAINAMGEEALAAGALMYVGQDEVRAGREACARLGAKTVSGNATVLFLDVINGTDAGINSRLEGCKETATVSYLNAESGNATADAAAIAQRLRANNLIDAVLAMGGPTQVVAALAAIEEVGRVPGVDIWVATTDWSPHNVTQALQAELLEFVVDQQAPLQGSVPVQLLASRAATGNFPIATEIFTGPRFILPNATFAPQNEISACSAYALAPCGACGGNATYVVAECPKSTAVRAWRSAALTVAAVAALTLTF